MVKGANQRLKFIPETEQAAGIEPLTFRFRIKSVGPAAVSTVRTLLVEDQPPGSMTPQAARLGDPLVQPDAGKERID